QLAFVLGGESVKLQSVVADHELRVEHDLLPYGWHVAERLGRDRQLVADPAATHNDVARASEQDLPRDQRDHTAPTALASGARLRSHTATASASAAWSDAGCSASPSRRVTILATCCFPARPCPQTAPLTCCGVYERAGSPRCPAASKITPRAWPTANAVRALVPKY